jgi:hypothetical protein
MQNLYNIKTKQTRALSTKIEFSNKLYSVWKPEAAITDTVGQ